MCAHLQNHFTNIVKVLHFFPIFFYSHIPAPHFSRNMKKISKHKPVKGKFSILASALLVCTPSAIGYCTVSHTQLNPSSPPFDAMHYCRDLSPISLYNTEVIIYIHFRKQQHRLVLAYANIKLGKIWETQRTPY